MATKKFEQLKKSLISFIESKHTLKKLLPEIVLGFYLVAENNENPTIEEKIEVLKLINSVNKELVDYAETYRMRFYTPWEQDEELTCKLHSGFQFLKDDYIEPLKDQLELKEKESLEQLCSSLEYEEMDDCMQNWKENTVSYKPPKPNHVPASHFWWNIAKA